MKLSIIIPVYNTPEVYLRKSLRSVTVQTYSDAEFLIIIDGATDNSPKVCVEFAEADARFKVFNKQNSGAGATRNYGLDQATGEYVMFIDADDYWLDSRLLETVAGLLSESRADILSFGYSEFYSENDKPLMSTPDNLPRERILNNADAVKCFLKAPRSTFSSSIITKVVKLSFIRENNISFREGINGEDTHFTAQLIHYAKTYDRLNQHVYAVRRHRRSTSRNATADERVIKSMLIIFDELFGLFGLTNHADSPVLDFLASPYLYILGKTAALPNPKLYIRQMQKYKFVMTHSSRPYVKATGVVANIVGLRLTITALRVFLSINHRSHVSIYKAQKGNK